MRTSDARLVDFGRAVRRARRDRDMSQEALAHAAGLAAKHVSEIERANRDVRLTTLLQIADGLGMRPGELLGLYDEERARAAGA
jgi:transcriptional regulator with XRE-family HTH domain